MSSEVSSSAMQLRALLTILQQSPATSCIFHPEGQPLKNYTCICHLETKLDFFAIRPDDHAYVIRDFTFPADHCFILDIFANLDLLDLFWTKISMDFRHILEEKDPLLAQEEDFPEI